MDEHKCISWFHFLLPADKPSKLKQVTIPTKITLQKFKNKTLNECNEACYQYEECNSYKYNENDKLCSLTNVLPFNNELKPNDGNWDVYILNPGQWSISILFMCSYDCMLFTYIHLLEDICT